MIMTKEEKISKKDQYKIFCSKESNIPIFSQPWWLDAVSGEKMWNVCLIEKGGIVVASMPYLVKRKFGFKISTMPKLTQTLGPFIKYPSEQKYYKKLSWDKKIMTSIIKQLPKVDYFSQNFSSEISNWLPFFWNDFEETTRYTYIIENISLEDLERKFENDVRRRCKNAKDLGVKVFESDEVEKFYDLNKKTFKRKNMDVQYDLKFVKNLYSCCKINSSVKMFFAEHDKRLIAANFVVYDNNTVYYIMGGIDEDKKDLGGMDIVLYESIKFALQSGRKFDFEGSMTESIEKYFRSFGAAQKQFFNISKYNSKILKLGNTFNLF